VPSVRASDERQRSCWGNITVGEVGTPVQARSPVMIATGATDLAVAGCHGCVINADTTISCWGQDGAFAAATLTPTAIGITGATAIAAGANSECAIVGASVQCWGTIHDGAGTLAYLSPGAARTFTIAATQIAVGDGHACAVVGTDVQCWGDRTHWGGTGIATSPEAVMTTTVAPAVYASDAGTVILDQGTIVLNVYTGLPDTLAVDGDTIAFTPGMAERSGCAGVGTGATCWGVEHGQHGRSNGCDATPATTALALP
jgi:hypothetical protein